MFSKDLYIVTISYPDLRDTKVEQFYDADIYTLNTLLTGYKSQLQGLNVTISQFNGYGFIDVINNDGMIDCTYVITKKKGFISKQQVQG